MHPGCPFLEISVSMAGPIAGSQNTLPKTTPIQLEKDITNFILGNYVGN